MIVFGLCGQEREKDARLLLDQLSRLSKDFGDCQQAFGTLGTHVKRAHGRYSEVDTKLGRFSDKFSDTAAGAALPSPEDHPALTKESGDG
jgi:hypothetical protein